MTLPDLLKQESIRRLEEGLGRIHADDRVWPNPVQADGQVQVQLELPESFSPQGDLRIMIISSDGRSVHEDQIGNSSTLQLLNCPQLSSGLYHIHLTDANRWIRGAKLVVE